METKELIESLYRLSGVVHHNNDNRSAILIHEAATRLRDLHAELRKWKPMTAQEAEAEMAKLEAGDIEPLSDADIQRMMAKINDPTFKPTEPEHVGLLHEINRLKAAQQWRPIEEVTQDAMDSGTVYDLWSPKTHTCVLVGRYWEQDELWAEDGTDDVCEPTYFRERPLPPAPQGGEG